ncbi:hypothetical protein GCM10009624_25640 [Gordonia sinesedis]
MDRRTLAFIALAITMLYGVGFAVIDDAVPYAPIGGVIVALAWVSVGVFGKDKDGEGRDGDRRL